MYYSLFTLATLFLSFVESDPVTKESTSPDGQQSLLDLPPDVQGHIASYVKTPKDRANYERTHKSIRKGAFDQDRSISFQVGRPDKLISDPNYCLNFESKMERWSKVHTMFITLNVFKDCFVAKGKLEKLTSLRNLTIEEISRQWSPTVWTEPWYLRLVSHLKKVNSHLKVNVYNSGKTSLLQFAITSSNTEWSNFWIARALDLNFQDLTGLTALMVDVKKEHPDAVDKLIQARVDLDIQDEDGMTALMFASVNEHPDIVVKLIQAGANVNIQNRKGQTALMGVSRYGNSSIVEKLIQKGAKVNIKDLDGYTALLFASRKGDPMIVKQLIQAGANVNSQNAFGETALKIASERGRDDIVDILTRAGATA